MAYNVTFFLQKVITIQDLTIEHTRKGVKQEWVYSNLVFPNYGISRATYYRYLATPAKMKIKQLRAVEPAKQMQLF